VLKIEHIKPYHLFIENAMTEVIVDFYGKERLLEAFPNLFIDYLYDGYYINIVTLDYLYKIGFRIPRSMILSDIIFTESMKVWNWFYTHGLPMDYTTFYSVLSSSMEIEYKQKAIAWLLDNNCPYKK
jgi:hypothetical protein